MKDIILRSLTSEMIQSVRKPLLEGNQNFRKQNPGDPIGRQPIHTVYGGAQIFNSTVAQKMSEAALKALKTYAPSPKTLAQVLLPTGSAPSALWDQVYERVLEKLKREAVEDFRIDFEDGYGIRPDSEEDAHAQSTALEVAQGMAHHTLPPFIGIRIKPFNEDNVMRSIRTLDIFLSTLLSKTGGLLPDGFVVTLPKITIAEQAEALSNCLSWIEKKQGLESKTIKFEIMVETPQSILCSSGQSPLRKFVEAGDGRCIGAHFGTYDYTAGCNVTAQYQTMANPVCDFAKHVMQVSLAGTPIFLSDGATNIMPVGPHRETQGQPLSDQQSAENRAVVHRAWRKSDQHIRHSLETGFYQGWDLHPAQLPIRYATTYIFFLEGLEETTKRLKSFMEKAAKATLLGDIFDDAATGQGLLNFFLRGISCGAISEAEAEATGLTLEEIRTRSFLKVLEARKTSGGC
ncbi:MAG: phosphoenolpyruvate kinase [Bdellovibrionia bacterium]